MQAPDGGPQLVHSSSIPTGPSPYSSAGHAPCACSSRLSAVSPVRPRCRRRRPSSWPHCRRSPRPRLSSPHCRRSPRPRRRRRCRLSPRRRRRRHRRRRHRRRLRRRRSSLPLCHLSPRHSPPAHTAHCRRRPSSGLPLPRRRHPPRCRPRPRPPPVDASARPPRRRSRPSVAPVSTPRSSPHGVFFIAPAPPSRRCRRRRPAASPACWSGELVG